ncbi:hypothetical protein ACH5RR_036246 [Cinchona calisaya]|uniref:RING-type domain-containing protein n=1 Tax=Cinchona calisaya TaxID=153742 RepID=A0ABD2Y7E4_9GENT
MGLQNQLTDISTESIPILMITLIANCVACLRSILFDFFQTFGLKSVNVFDITTNMYQLDDSSCDSVGSGLTGVIMLADQLNQNRAQSYKYEGGASSSSSSSGLDCVVCLNGLDEGEHVRKLAACRHVFHKDCFEGWLDHLNFNCPLCRTPLVPDERVAFTKRRVAGDVLAWFGSL